MRGAGVSHNNGCTPCGKSRYQVCNVMFDSDTFTSHVTDMEYKIDFKLNCDSSNVVYLIECKVCGAQYLGSTCTPFRLRFNNYKACNRKFIGGSSGIAQAEFSGTLQGRIIKGSSKILKIDRL